MKRKFLPAVIVLAMVMVLVLGVFVACDNTTQYTVTFRFSANNEQKVQVNAGEKVAAADIPAPTEGYAWYVADAQGNPTATAFTANYVVNGDTLVVLKLLVTPPTEYTVTFRFSATDERTVNVNEGGKVAAADIPAPTEDYAWYIANAQGEPTETAFTSETVVNGDLLVVLKQVKFTVTFRFSADNEQKVKVNAGAKVAEEDIPAPTAGHVWYVADQEGKATETAFTSETVVNSNTLVVLVELTKYTVTFHYGEDNEQEVEVYAGETVAQIPAPTAGHVWYVADQEGNPTATKFTADTVIENDMTVVLKDMLEGKAFNSSLVYSSATWYWIITFDGHGNIDCVAWYQGHREESDDCIGTYSYEEDEYGLKLILNAGKSGLNKTYYVESEDVIVFVDLDAQGNDKNYGMKYMYTEQYVAPDLSAFAGYWGTEDNTEYVWFTYEEGVLTVEEASFKTYKISSSWDGKTVRIDEDSWGYTPHILTLTDEGISAKKGSNAAVLYIYKGETRTFGGFEAGLVGNWSTGLGWNIAIEQKKLTINGQEIAVMDKVVSGAVRYEFSYGDAQYYIAKGEIAGEYFVVDASGSKQFLYSNNAPIETSWYGNYTFTLSGTTYTIVVSAEGVTINEEAASKVAFLAPAGYDGSTTRTRGGIYFYASAVLDGDIYLYKDSNNHKRESAYGILLVKGNSTANATKQLEPITEPENFTLEGIWYSSESNYFFKFMVDGDSGAITAVSDYSSTISSVNRTATSGRYEVTIGGYTCDITVNSDGTITIVETNYFGGIYTKGAKSSVTFETDLQGTWKTEGYDSAHDSIGDVVIGENTISFSVNGTEVQVYSIKKNSAVAYAIITTNFEKWILATNSGLRLYNSDKSVDVKLVKETSGGGDNFDSYYSEVAGRYDNGSKEMHFNQDKSVEYYVGYNEYEGTWEITAVDDNTITIVATSTNSTINGTWTYDRINHTMTKDGTTWE